MALAFFNIYAKDFLGDSDVAAMSPAQRGALISLWCHAWQKNAELPVDDNVLARLAGFSPGPEWDAAKGAVLALFDREGDKLVSARLREEMKKAEKRVERANAGAAARHRKGASKPQAEPKQAPKQPPSSPQASLYDERKHNTPTPTPTPTPNTKQEPVETDREDSLDYWLTTKLNCDMPLITKIRKNSELFPVERLKGWWADGTGRRFMADNPEAYVRSQIKKALGIRDPPRHGQSTGIADTIAQIRQQRGIET